MGKTQSNYHSLFFKLFLSSFVIPLTSFSVIPFQMISVRNISGKSETENACSLYQPTSNWSSLVDHKAWSLVTWILLSPWNGLLWGSMKTDISWEIVYVDVPTYETLQYLDFAYKLLLFTHTLISRCLIAELPVQVRCTILDDWG